MTIATLPVSIEETQLDDLFDLDVRIDVTETNPEAGFTSFGCSLTCHSCLNSLCYC
ncbi:hypothetical protein GCM10009665_71050 [Kitasatospora nipponensis]|uniref:FxLD family lantipeptide n=1 Tax=Kitasatospora nipponensis TaxID=258049 RepID=A0ABP4HPU8_9ACTN